MCRVCGLPFVLPRRPPWRSVFRFVTQRAPRFVLYVLQAGLMLHRFSKDFQSIGLEVGPVLRSPPFAVGLLASFLVDFERDFQWKMTRRWLPHRNLTFAEKLFISLEDGTRWHMLFCLLFQRHRQHAADCLRVSDLLNFTCMHLFGAAFLAIHPPQPPPVPVRRVDAGALMRGAQAASVAVGDATKRMCESLWFHALTRKIVFFLGQ